MHHANISSIAVPSQVDSNFSHENHETNVNLSVIAVSFSGRCSYYYYCYCSPKK